MPDIMMLHPRMRVMAMFGDARIPVRVTMSQASRDRRDKVVVQLEESTGYRGTTDTLAYATPLEGSGASSHISFDQLLSENCSPAFANLLLAHVMVNEITHVVARRATREILP
jgi:hypothetical protein